MIRSALFASFVCVFVGCSRQPSVEGQPEARVVVARPPEPTELNLISEQPPGAKTPSAPMQPVAFEYPADLGGQLVAKVVTPKPPPLPAGEKLGVTPKPRAIPVRLLEPEFNIRVKSIPQPILPAKPSEVKLTSPPERVPAALGQGADDVPAKPKLPVAPGITQRARDVNLPPAMPTLGRPASDRVSLDDPTTEFGNAVIVAPPVKVPLTVAGFLKVALPNPFELGEQVKPKLPPTVEPGLTPVPVNPQRVK